MQACICSSLQIKGSLAIPALPDDIQTIERDIVTWTLYAIPRSWPELVVILRSPVVEVNQIRA